MCDVVKSSLVKIYNDDLYRVDNIREHRVGKLMVIPITIFVIASFVTN